MGENNELVGVVTSLANTVQALVDHQKQQAEAKPEPKSETKPDPKPDPDNSRETPLTATGKKVLDEWVNSDTFQRDVKLKKEEAEKQYRLNTGKTF